MQKKRWYILFVCCMLLLVSGNAQVPLFLDDTDSIPSHDSVVHKLNPKKNISHETANRDVKLSPRIDSVVNIAFGYYGKRYRRGGTGAQGFDCSGFTMIVFKQVGIKLPHTSAGQGLIGVSVSRQNIHKGDLILFRGANRRSSRIGHVGIVISEKGEPIKFIHSSTSSGVRVDFLDAPYYRNRYVKTVRVPELYK